MRNGGFTLVELMIVIAILAVVAAIAVPNLLSGQRAANERSAASTLRSLSTAETDFRGGDRENNRLADFWTGDLSGLYRLQDPLGNPIALVELPVAQMDGSPLPGGSANGLMGPLLPPLANKAGYWIMALVQDESAAGGPADYKLDTDGQMELVHNRDRYGFIAYPEAFGSSGENLFIINESGVVFRRNPGQSVLAGGGPPSPILPAWLNYPNNPMGVGWGKLD